MRASVRLGAIVPCLCQKIGGAQLPATSDARAIRPGVSREHEPRGPAAATWESSGFGCVSPKLSRIMSRHAPSGGLRERTITMHLQLIDWVIVVVSLLICFVPALFFGKRAGKSTSEFFASGRAVPWWLAGLSMVATTFSSDTPNLVTDIVRRNGVAGNWVWWAFVLTGVATVFFYARLWRRSGRDDRPRVLRDPLLRQGRRRRARLPLGLPRAVLQLHDHGDGQPGRVQDRRHPLRPASAGRRWLLVGRAQRRLRRALGPLGRARHRHDPVLHQDDGGDRRGLLRACSCRRSAA
ncbi:MAG: hypothetical protein MZU79_06305 [Anaerotruncus sp.]|nr:hypothetical protein [Anaerotruncus sp.]